MSDSTAIPNDTTAIETRYTITLINGQTKILKRGVTATVDASGAIKTTTPGGANTTWYGPSAWLSMEAITTSTT